MTTQLTQQEIVAYHSLHHFTLQPPKWSGNPHEWPICIICDGDILTTGDTESGPLWACKDPECEMA